MEDFKVNKWEASYERLENYIFFPKEEVVKFLNRYVKKKSGVDSYKNILQSSTKLKALDLGCGIGR